MGRLGRGVRLCLEEPFLPHCRVGSGRSLLAEELWERLPEQKQGGKISLVKGVPPNPVPSLDPRSGGFHPWQAGRPIW